ncbi:MAG: hypothetical protein EOL89_13880 [Actinobacteria bacterium]|nr:hypothetical protein [Actinomycetota bacterium]
MLELLSGLSLAAGVALFVLFLRTRALGTATRWIVTLALATVALLAGIGLSLIAWPGTPGALIAAAAGAVVGARAAAIVSSRTPPTSGGPAERGG